MDSYVKHYFHVQLAQQRSCKKMFSNRSYQMIRQGKNLSKGNDFADIRNSIPTFRKAAWYLSVYAHAKFMKPYLDQTLSPNL